MSDWNLLGEWSYSSNVSYVDFYNLFGVTEVLVDARDITGSSAAIISFYAGSNSVFFDTNGDYSVAIDHVESDQDRIRATKQATVDARSARVHIVGFNLAGQSKPVINSDATETMRMNYVDRSEPLDCVRVTHDSGTITGGNVKVYGR